MEDPLASLGKCLCMKFSSDMRFVLNIRFSNTNYVLK